MDIGCELAGEATHNQPAASGEFKPYRTRSLAVEEGELCTCINDCDKVIFTMWSNERYIQNWQELVSDVSVLKLIGKIKLPIHIPMNAPVSVRGMKIINGRFIPRCVAVSRAF